MSRAVDLAVAGRHLKSFKEELHELSEKYDVDLEVRMEGDTNGIHKSEVVVINRMWPWKEEGIWET